MRAGGQTEIPSRGGPAEEDKIDGVNFVSIAYITGRMTLDADAERFDEVLSAVEKACSRIEPDLRIVR